jgi:WD40 repeat protein
MFGVKSDVTNNILFVDDNYVIYPCGHNIVIYKIDDKTQRYIPGIQGSEGITALALSANKKWLAVCEKATKAICSVYNIAQFIAAQKEKKIFVYDQNNKKKRILVSSEYDSSRFISASFSNLNEKQIATLTGEPNYQVILWAWDKQKCIAVADCNIIIG